MATMTPEFSARLYKAVEAGFLTDREVVLVHDALRLAAEFREGRLSGHLPDGCRDRVVTLLASAWEWLDQHRVELAARQKELETP